jgi:hypothetical protein
MTSPKHNYEIPQVNWSELVPNPDFETQLDRAFASPLHRTLGGHVHISSEDLADRDQYFSPKASLPDDVLIKSYESPANEYAAATDDPALYPLLLGQAIQRLEITKGFADPGLKITPELEKVSNHEINHGRMAQAFGIRSRYGVRVLYDPNEKIWAISPFHSLTGDEAGTIMLTRLQEAAIAAAPEDASAADLHTVRALGYSSREEVLGRLYEVYPHLEPQS